MSPIEIIHTDSTHPDFRKLAAEMEEELYLLDGDSAVVKHELNKIDFLDVVVLLYHQNKVVACGGFRKYDSECAEIKRMYVIPDYRRQKLASTILNELEKLAGNHHFTYCLLETGDNQPGAIFLYEKHGYDRVPNFGKYKESINSVCFKKKV